MRGRVQQKAENLNNKGASGCEPVFNFFDVCTWDFGSRFGAAEERVPSSSDSESVVSPPDKTSIAPKERETRIREVRAEPKLSRQRKVE
jgi:hypothetical protein